ncbi:unnamed protein product [Arabis nemorensis]|uniref:KIB1-4 beta-propeller domain-containing protein n=1 Tax=Arabis nemorensis TaxID=586526 RepID=A0A565CUR8_9BRAS|nr:unnamed protein product [Arabis nemorensis]
MFFEVYSLGDDEVLLLDSGVNVPADHTLGMEPNSIYFTRLDRFRPNKHFLDICVFNRATKSLERFLPKEENLKRFPGFSNLKLRDFPDLKLKDALWFLSP